MSDKVTMDDLDRFFYLLEHGVQEDPDTTIDVVVDLGIDKSRWWKRLLKIKKMKVVTMHRWEGYCMRHGWTPEQACDLISSVIKDAFYPLKMLPGTSKVTTGKQEIIYDLAWLVSVVSAVHRTCGALQAEIMHTMPMMLALHYYVQAGIDAGVKGIGRRTSDELALAYDKRSCELISERLAELKVIKEEEKEMYAQMMMGNEEDGTES